MAAALAVALLSILVVGTWFYLTQRRQLHEQAERSLRAIAEMKAAQVSKWRMDQLAEGEELQGSPRFTDTLDGFVKGSRDHDAEQLFSRLRALQRHYGYADVLLTDPTAEVCLSLAAAGAGSPNAAPSLGARSRALVAEALAGGVTRLGELEPCAGATCLDVVVPLFAAGRRPVGAVVLRHDAAASLFPLVGTWPVPTGTAEALLVRVDGNDVLYLSPLRFRQAAPLSLRIPLSTSDNTAVRAALGETNVMLGRDYRGELVFSAPRPIPGSQWVLLAEIDEDEAMAPWRYRSRGILGLMLLALAASAAIAGAIWQASARSQDRALLDSEVARAASETQYRQLFDHSVSGVAVDEIVLDERGAPVDWIWVDVNRAFEKQTGLAAEAVRGRRAREVLPDIEQSFIDAFGRVALSGEPAHFEQYTAALGRWYSVVAYRVAPLRVAVVFDDITDRKRAEASLKELNDALERRVAERTAQLEAANKELEAFSYSVSHDLRAPLRAVIGYAGILEEDHAPHLDTNAKRILGIVRDEARRMGGLIDDLLAFSRTGRQSMRAVPVDMTAMAREALAELQRLEPEREVEVRVGEIPAGHADPALVRQVWSNLIGNALKFTRRTRPARVEIGGERRGDECVYFVRDNGSGFDMQYAGKLFGVFQRLHRQEDFEGNGVGLALVQRIVTRHGGRTWAEGAVDGGATFYFSLPCREDQPA